MKKIRFGTRSSALAMEQTDMVVQALKARDPDIVPDIVTIRTSGDWSPDKGEVRLDPDKGGKGQFVSAIENRLIDGHIDAAVHSLKDVPSIMPKNVRLDHFMPSEDPRDVFVCDTARSPDDLPKGSVIGTASLRRQSLIKKLWPHLDVHVIRGNVQTRIDKMRQGQVDALILAMAGLIRLNLKEEMTHILDPDEFIPCGGQGIVAIEVMRDNHDLSKILDPLTCPGTAIRATIERAFLKIVGGSCHSPIGIHARRDNSNKEWVISSYAGTPEADITYFHTTRASAQNLMAAERTGADFGRAFLKKMTRQHISHLGLTQPDQ